MMTTVARAFVDTNVLLRSIQSAMPLHTEAAALIAKARNDGYELWVSRQVIREYIVQVTRPIATMLVYGTDTLLTQNVEDMKRFSSKIKLLPLIESVP